MRGTLLYITTLGLVAVIATGRAQSRYAIAGITDARQVAAFLSELQRASRENDRKALAALVRYPATVTIGGLRIPFGDAAALLERADAIFTPALQATIARAAVADAPPPPGREPIFVSEAGLLIGANGVEIKLIDGRLRITAIVVPRADGDASDDPFVRPGRRQDPRRLTIGVGPRPARVSALLTTGVVDSYVVLVNKGQRLEVRLERVPVGAAALRVVQAQKGTPLNPAASDTARVVSGRALEGADYLIEVRRLIAADATALPYLLSVGVR